jgi:hypothetical protein
LFLVDASTRQSSRYKDDLQTTRVTTATVSKPKPKRKFKVEFPFHYSDEKVGSIFAAIHGYSLYQEKVRRSERIHRRNYLQERIKELQKEDSEMQVDHSPPS